MVILFFCLSLSVFLFAVLCALSGQAEMLPNQILLTHYLTNLICVFFPACCVWRNTRKIQDAVGLEIKQPLWPSHSLMKWLFSVVSIFLTPNHDWKTARIVLEVFILKKKLSDTVEFQFLSKYCRMIITAKSNLN